MPTYNPTAIGGGVVDTGIGSIGFSLSGKQYLVTWGSKGIWCELCALEKKGDPVEVGSQELGTYWVKEGTPAKSVAIDHMTKHIAEM